MQIDLINKVQIKVPKLLPMFLLIIHNIGKKLDELFDLSTLLFDNLIEFLFVLFFDCS